MARNLEGWSAMDSSVSENVLEETDLKLSTLVKNQNKKKVKSGGFQVMGLSSPVLQGVLKKGYKIPTPIQRKAIPVILEGKDVVAMARTGSGKTAAFLIPLFERLKIHSARVGARALIMSPTRELAMQTLTFAKELGKFTGLRAATVLGGVNIETQFAAIHENPDIIIATPGRFAHVCVEMNLNLETVEYVVFDEADRLFEMGFKEQLNDVVNRLRSFRQTLLFSATLPKVLVEFARAGLSDPVLIRLDVESKLSENLKLTFLKVNYDSKIAVLIHLLKHVVSTDELTLVFVPTKQHVEYIHETLSKVGLESTLVYSSLDPSARKINIAKFRLRKVSIMVVTDVAARGIDIPLLDNVINFNFPPKAKLFVHRVGRVARADRSGIAYSLVSPDEMSYLLDLHMFLNQSVQFCPINGSELGSSSSHLAQDRLLGKVPQDIIDDGSETVRKLLEQSFEINTLKRSADNGYKKYISTRPTSSVESIRRLREELWGSEVGLHPLYKAYEAEPIEHQRAALLETLKNVRTKTIFEVKKTGKSKTLYNTVLFMEEKRQMDNEKIKNHRERISKRRQLKESKENEVSQPRPKLEASTELDLTETFAEVGEKKENKKRKGNDKTSLNAESITERFSQPQPEMSSDGVLTPSNSYIPYAPSNRYTEESYSVMSNFERASSSVGLDLMGDDEGAPKLNPQRPKWDRRRKKFVHENQEKKIKTESGAWVSASMKRDLYQKWKLKMQPSQASDEDEDEGMSRRDWRNKSSSRENKKKRKFVSLTEDGTYKNRAHPLVKNRPGERTVLKKKGPRQLRTYEQRKKFVKEKNKKMSFDKKRQMARKSRRDKGKKKN